MAYRYEGSARRRAGLAGLVALTWVVLFGASLALPALALVALVYYVHPLAAALRGEEQIPYPGLALVIVANALVVLAVQLLLTIEGAA
jgi:hypothetical protein